MPPRVPPSPTPGATRGRWCTVISLCSPADLEGVATRVASGTTVLAPSRDGGTNLIAGTGHFAFAYGPGSFVRHIAAAAGAAPLVLIRTGLAVELDTPPISTRYGTIPRSLARRLPILTA